MSIFVNRDGSTEAWDGENYVPMGSMKVDPPSRTVEAFPPPPQLYMEIEEYPPVTIEEFAKLARHQRQQRARQARFYKLLRLAAELAARKPDDYEAANR